LGTLFSRFSKGIASNFSSNLKVFFIRESTEDCVVRKTNSSNTMFWIGIGKYDSSKRPRSLVKPSTNCSGIFLEYSSHENH
jgi:hypothetical protein